MVTFILLLIPFIAIAYYAGRLVRSDMFHPGDFRWWHWVCIGGYALIIILMLSQRAYFATLILAAAAAIAYIAALRMAKPMNTEEYNSLLNAKPKFRTPIALALRNEERTAQGLDGVGIHVSNDADNAETAKTGVVPAAANVNLLP